MHILDLNDLQFGLLHRPSLEPACVSQAGKKQLFGSAALAQWRLEPQLFHSHYVQNLSSDSQVKSLPGINSSADLLWHQLQQIEAKERAQISLLLYPSHYSQEQLALLSGVLQSAGIERCALVNRALAIGAVSGTATVCDSQLHQTLLCKTQTQSGKTTLVSTEVKAKFSAITFFENALQTLRTAFIESTRFDPLYHAATEQQLFDQLWQKTMHQEADRHFNIVHGKQRESVELLVEVWEKMMQQNCAALSDERLAFLDAPWSKYLASQQSDSVVVSASELALALQPTLELVSTRSKGFVHLEELETDLETEKPEQPVVKPPSATQQIPRATRYFFLRDATLHSAENSYLVADQDKQLLVTATPDQTHVQLGRTILNDGQLLLTEANSALRVQALPCPEQQELGLGAVISATGYSGTLLLCEHAEHAH